MRWLLLALCACAAAAIDCAKVPDHYATLNVTKNATYEEIRVAARAAQLRAHPDKVYHAGDKTFLLTFVEVRTAMEHLLDPKKKKAYDRRRKYCQRPWILRWAKKQQYKWSRWSSRWVHALPVYVIIIYIGDPTALWALIAPAWAWVMANPGMTAGAVAVAIVAVGATARFFL